MILMSGKVNNGREIIISKICKNIPGKVNRISRS